jgi:hypothetical protein
MPLTFGQTFVVVRLVLGGNPFASCGASGAVHAVSLPTARSAAMMPACVATFRSTAWLLLAAPVCS